MGWSGQGRFVAWSTGRAHKLVQELSPIQPPTSQNMVRKAQAFGHKVVPLVRDAQIATVTSNGLSQLYDPNGRPAPGAQLDAILGWRSAKSEEIPDEGAEALGIATRYHDRFREQKQGSVRGDGRLVTIGDVPRPRANTNLLQSFAALQLKGEFETGLEPVAAVD